MLDIYIFLIKSFNLKSFSFKGFLYEFYDIILRAF